MSNLAFQYDRIPDTNADFDDDLLTMALVLETLGLVDTAPDEAFDKFTRLTTAMLAVPVALVSFVEEDRDRQYFKSQVGLQGHWAEDRQTPLSHSFCQFVKRDNRPLVIESAPDDARVCDNLAITDLGLRAYLGAPVHGPMGEALGALCAIDTVARSWSERDIELIVDLAACVTDQISLRSALQRAHSFCSGARRVPETRKTRPQGRVLESVTL